MNKYSMFYNYHIIGDILMIVFNHKEKPTHYTKKDDVVGIYHAIRSVYHGTYQDRKW